MSNQVKLLVFCQLIVVLKVMYFSVRLLQAKVALLVATEGEK
jgi:hypothetical protein